MAMSFLPMIALAHGRWRSMFFAEVVNLPLALASDHLARPIGMSNMSIAY